MLISRMRDIPYLRLDCLPLVQFKVERVHLLVGVAVSLAAAVQVHLVLVHERGVVRDSPWVHLSDGVYLSPLEGALLSVQASTCPCQRLQICVPYGRNSSFIQISTSHHI